MNRLNTIANQIPPAGWVLKHHIRFPFERVGDLKGKTVVISGGSRGIGLACAVRCAQDGANVAILAKTDTPHPKLPGTIHTAAADIEAAGGRALPLLCDIRFENQVSSCIDKVVETFGGIDILINNASAISLTDTESTSMKTYDLMHQINTRGTFLMSKYCIPHLKKSENGHILNMSPPLSMQSKWFAPHCAYTMAKFGMSLCVLGMSQEFAEDGVGVNALWPRTAIATAAVKNLLGGDDAVASSRKETIMADAAYEILTSNSKTTTGQFFIDDEVVICEDLRKYNVDPNLPIEKLAPDFFI